MPRDPIKKLLQHRRRQLREAEKAHRKRLQAADQLALGLRRQSDVIVRAYRLASGTLAQARRRKMVNERSYETDSPFTLQLRDLIDRVRRGDEIAVKEMNLLLDDTPELWQELGDLARHVETNWINLLANDPLLQESLRRECQRRRTELLGEDPSPIQQHLAERVIASWLQLKHAEIEMASSRGATEQHLNFLHKRLESSQKQHLAAMREFIKVCPRGKAARQDADRPHDHATGKPSQRRTRHRVVAT